MKLRNVALAITMMFACAPAVAQVNPGTSPLSGPKGGTNNAFMQFSGPSGSLKTYFLPNINNAGLAALNALGTWTSVQSFSDGTMVLLGASSGQSTLKAPATGGGTATLFPGTDTVAGLAAAQALTNKTISCASNTCTVRIANDVSGLGTLVATALGVNVGSVGSVLVNGGTLGTPSSGVATNLTGTAAGLTAGTVTTNANLTGPVTSVGNATTLAAQGAYTFICNNTGGSASPGSCDATAFTLKASPAASDIVVIQDSAASFAYKKTTAAALSAVGSVASIDTLTGAVTLLTGSQGRITLTAGTPIMTASVAGSPTLHYVNFFGNQVAYFNGSADVMDYIPANDTTDAMVSAASAGQVVAGNLYDMWWAHGGANRICLAMSSAVGGGGGWTSDTGGSNTARGTGYTQIDQTTRPYPTNKNAIPNCFNAGTNYGPISANQGTLLGTVEASANGQVSYIFGASSSGGTAGLFGIWNINPVTTVSSVTDSGSFYNNYSSATPRQARASAGNQIQFLIGLPGYGVTPAYSGEAATIATGASVTFGLGFDSTSAYSCQANRIITPTGATANRDTKTTTCAWNPGVGFHTLYALENSDSTNLNQFDNSGTNTLSISLSN